MQHVNTTNDNPKMYAKSFIAVAALAGAVSAAPVAEKQAPKGWWTEGLEPYMTCTLILSSVHGVRDKTDA